jgi:hypothetical protein
MRQPDLYLVGFQGGRAEQARFQLPGPDGQRHDWVLISYKDLLRRQSISFKSFAEDPQRGLCER